jgi:hypothetical protein
MSFWNNIPRSTVRELSKAAGLRSSNAHAVADLEDAYGPVPTIEFVDEMWIVLRDGWLQRTAAPRLELIRQMRAIGRGDMTIKTGSKAGQVAYLRSLRRSPALLEPLLELFLESGSEERPEPVFAQAPSDAGDQQTAFYAAVSSQLRAIDAGTISGLERVVTSAGRSAMADIAIPAENALESAVRLAGVIVTALLVDHDDIGGDADTQAHHAMVLDGIRTRAADALSTEEFVQSYVYALKPAFEDPDATTESVASYASAVFFAMLAVSSPDEGPGLVEQIRRSHQRFTTSRTSGESAARAEHEFEVSFDEALIEAMQELPMASEPMRTDQGGLIWQVYMGSATVRVMRLPRPDVGPTTLRFVSQLVSGISESLDVLTTLNLVSGRDSFHKLYWTDDAVILEYDFAMDGFDERLFRWLLAGFLGTADSYDTLLHDRFGGAMAGADQHAVFDA